jgi:hypothetical protein
MRHAYGNPYRDAFGHADINANSNTFCDAYWHA